VENRRDQRPYNVAYYQAHRSQELERVKTRQRNAVEFIRSLRDVPCDDCGGRFPPYAMDFDHRGRRSEIVLGYATGGLGLSGSPTRRARKVRHRLCKSPPSSYPCAGAGTSPNPHEAGDPPGIESRLRRDQTALLQQLRDVACADCHQRFPFFAMDFDHRDPADKLFEVPRMLGRVTTQELLEEVSKCDIVCANCHRDRTYRWHAARRIEIARE